MASPRLQQFRERLEAAKKNAILASAGVENSKAGKVDLDDDPWQEVEEIQAKLKAAEKEQAETEERARKQIAKSGVDNISPAAAIKAEDSEATATQLSPPRISASMVAAMTPQQLQEKLAAARKELRKAQEENQPASVYIEARNKVDVIRSKYKAAVKEETERAERARNARIIKIKKPESAEPERTPVVQTKIERGSSAGRIKAEISSPNAQGLQLPLHQYLHTSKANSAALRLQKAKDAYEDAVAGPAGHPPPKQLIIDLDNNAWRTFLSFNGIRSIGNDWEIWNFKTSKWVDWNVKDDPEHACWLLWEYAKRVLSVIYFCTHQCRSKDLEQYIPERFYRLLYEPDIWAIELKKRRSQLHGYVLRLQVQRLILPRWQDDLEYPTMPIDAENDTEADKAARVTFFKKKAEKDEVALQEFVGAMGDSIDWQKIAEKGTEENVAAWGNGESLVSRRQRISSTNSAMKMKTVRRTVINSSPDGGTSTGRYFPLNKEDRSRIIAALQYCRISAVRKDPREATRESMSQRNSRTAPLESCGSDSIRKAKLSSTSHLMLRLWKSTDSFGARKTWFAESWDGRRL